VRKKGVKRLVHTQRLSSYGQKELNSVDEGGRIPNSKVEIVKENVEEKRASVGQEVGSGRSHRSDEGQNE